MRIAYYQCIFRFAVTVELPLSSQGLLRVDHVQSVLRLQGRNSCLYLQLSGCAHAYGDGHSTTLVCPPCVKRFLHMLFTWSTSIRRHITEHFERVSVFLGVDPVLPVSTGVSNVPDVLTGVPGVWWEITKFLWIQKVRQTRSSSSLLSPPSSWSLCSVLFY